MTKTFKDMMIEAIRNHQYYEDGVLERLSESKVREIYETVVNWIEE